MLCENCNENEATFHYTEVVNGIMTQHHLCSECAAKMGLTGFAESPSADFPFARLLTGLLAASNRSTQEQDNPMMNVKCPKCGMKYQEFIRIGKFGCADCYDVLELKEMIQQHVAYTNSIKGKQILDNFGDYLPKFKKIVPHDYKRMMQRIVQMEEKGLSSEQAQIEAFYANKAAK